MPIHQEHLSQKYAYLAQAKSQLGLGKLNKQNILLKLKLGDITRINSINLYKSKQQLEMPA